MPVSLRDRVVIHPVPSDRSALREIRLAAERRGFHRFAVGPEEPAGAEGVVLSDESLQVPRGPRIPRRSIGSASELDDALRASRGERALAIRWLGDRVIPLENALARRDPSLELWITDVTPRDAPALLGALEAGADHVVVDVRTSGEIEELERGLDAVPRPPQDWTEATVTAVRPAGIGDRVLLDTTSLLGPDEGFAVGSSAALLALVLSEAVGSRFTRPRRFRVNAGGPHSYVLMADGTTRYLSELEPAEELLALSTSGEARGVRLGRSKIERRPLVVVTLRTAEREGTVFLQEAETVRLSGLEAPVSVTELTAGARVRTLRLPEGRHLGGVVRETVEER